MYLTYDEYMTMGGNALEETAFQQLEFEARTVIDWWTFNRLQKEETYPEAVKRCMFRLVSLIRDKQASMIVNVSTNAEISNVQAGIASESNDGVSTSYNTLSAKDAVDAIQDAIKDTITMYLTGVKNSLGHRLLYRGVYPNE
jgi:hypothetical protein